MSEVKAERWGLARRIGFRFALVLFVLLYFPAPIDSVPFLDRVAGLFLQGRLAVGVWLGSHVLHLAVPPTGTYTGDGVVGWVLLGAEVTMAIVAAAVWSALDAKATAYPRLDEALRIYLRFMLAGIMLGYGFVKVFCLQFPPPSQVMLLKTYGESPPADLLWTFMGASPGYQIFGGVAEIVGAMLLVFRRTATLGALVLVGVLANVVALNLFYDVSVKLYSMTLFATAVFLVAPEAPRLARAVVGKAVPARADVVLFPSKRGRIAADVAKAAFLLTIAIPMAWRTSKDAQSRASESAGPLAGF